MYQTVLLVVLLLTSMDGLVEVVQVVPSGLLPPVADEVVSAGVAEHEAEAGEEGRHRQGQPGQPHAHLQLAEDEQPETISETPITRLRGSTRTEFMRDRTDQFGADMVTVAGVADHEVAVGHHHHRDHPAA